MEPWKKASLTVAPPEVTRPSTGWVLVRSSDRLVSRVCRGERIVLGYLVNNCTEIPGKEPSFEGAVRGAELSAVYNVGLL
jgi:hypothetical protein